MKKLLIATIAGSLLLAACTKTITVPAATSSPTATTAESPSPLPPAEGVESPSPTQAEGSTLDLAFPPGSQVGNGKWKIQVVGYTPNADDAIHQENMFNDRPKPGEHYVLVTVKFWRTSGGASDPYIAFDWQLFGANGNRFKSAEYEVLPNDLIDVGKLPPGTSDSGNIAFLVPDGQKPAALWIGNVFLSIR